MHQKERSGGWAHQKANQGVGASQNGHQGLGVPSDDTQGSRDAERSTPRGPGCPKTHAKSPGSTKRHMGVCSHCLLCFQGALLVRACSAKPIRLPRRRALWRCWERRGGRWVCRACREVGAFEGWPWATLCPWTQCARGCFPWPPGLCARRQVLSMRASPASAPGPAQPPAPYDVTEPFMTSAHVFARPGALVQALHTQHLLVLVVLVLLVAAQSIGSCTCPAVPRGSAPQFAASTW